MRPPQKLKTHLVVFDALWGYRRDALEYANKLEKFDGKLGVLLDTLRDDYLFIITANHGNDSTHTGTDHTREKVPFIAYSTSQKKTGELEETDTFAIIGATITENFGIKIPENTIDYFI